MSVVAFGVQVIVVKLRAVVPIIQILGHYDVTLRGYNINNIYLMKINITRQITLKQHELTTQINFFNYAIDTF